MRAARRRRTQKTMTNGAKDSSRLGSSNVGGQSNRERVAIPQNAGFRLAGRTAPRRPCPRATSVRREAKTVAAVRPASGPDVLPQGSRSLEATPSWREAWRVRMPAIIQMFGAGAVRQVLALGVSRRPVVSWRAWSSHALRLSPADKRYAQLVTERVWGWSAWRQARHGQTSSRWSCRRVRKTIPRRARGLSDLGQGRVPSAGVESSSDPCPRPAPPG